MVRFIVAAVAAILLSVQAWAGGPVTTIVPDADSLTAPVTICQWFKPGDMKGPGRVLVDGTEYPSQWDIHSTWDDRSVCWAYVTWCQSMTAGQEYDVSFFPSQGAVLPSFDFRVPASRIFDQLKFSAHLTEQDGTRTSLVMDANHSLQTVIAMARGESKGSVWGSQVRELYGRFDWRHPRIELWVRWRIYAGKDPYVHCSIAIENCRATFTGSGRKAKADVAPVHYKDFTIDIGGNVISVVDKIHWQSTRWFHSGWIGTKPPNILVKHDIPYLSGLGIVPNVDTSKPTTEQYWAGKAASYRNSGKRNKEGPLGTYPVYSSQPDTAGRPDIGPWTKWWSGCVNGYAPTAVDFVTKSGTTGSGAFPVHQRDPVTGLMGLQNKHPFWGTNRANLVPKDKNGNKSKFIPNLAHAAAIGHDAHILTANPWCWEEWQAWAMWAVAQEYPNDKKAKGWFGRQQAWFLRHIMLAARACPDAHPDKAWWLSVVDVNKRHIQDMLNKTNWGPRGQKSYGAIKSSGRDTTFITRWDSYYWMGAWYQWALWFSNKMFPDPVWVEPIIKGFPYSEMILDTTPWRAPDGSMVTPDPDVLAQYSAVMSVCSPAMIPQPNNKPPVLGTLPGSEKYITSLGEMTWFTDIQGMINSSKFGKPGLATYEKLAAISLDPHKFVPPGGIKRAKRQRYWRYGPGDCGLWWVWLDLESEMVAAGINAQTIRQVSAAVKKKCFDQARSTGYPLGLLSIRPK